MVFRAHVILQDQKIPKPKRLQDWYKKMLDKGIIERIVLDYKDIFKQALEDNLQTPAELPYFDGDFWPGVLEENIREVEQVSSVGANITSRPPFVPPARLVLNRTDLFHLRKEEQARKKEMEEQERQAAAEAAAAAAEEAAATAGDDAATPGAGGDTSPDGKSAQQGKKKGNQKKKKSAAQRKNNAKKNSQVIECLC